MKYSSIKKRILALVLAMAVAAPNAMVAQAAGNTEVPEEITAVCDDSAQIVESEEGLASVSGVASEEVLAEAEEAEAEVMAEAKSKARSTASVEDTAEEEVEKLPCTIEYKSQIVEYGSEFEFGLTSDPEDLETINFIAGIDFSDAAEGSQTYVNVQMPGELGEMLGGEYTLADFRELLELAVGFGLADGMLEDFGFGDLGIDMSAVVQLVKIIEKIQVAAGTNDTIVIINEEYYPENVGVYIAGAVTADTTYETAFAVGYLVIVPAGERVDLAYDMETQNNIIAREFLVDGTFSLDASAYQDGVKNEEATEEINHLFIGLNSNGEFEVLNTAAGDDMLTQNGVWAQLSFTAEFDEMKYYSIPIGRAFKVMGEAVDVKLVNMDGIESNYQFSVYDGTGKGMTAVVYDKDGQLIPQDMVDKYINIKYIGYTLSAPEDIYMSNEMPTDAGVYSVLAVYGEDETTVEKPRFGMTVGAVLISQAASEVSVESVAHKYNKKKVDVKSMISTNPEDVDVAIITATLSDTANAENISLAKVTESINIDLPKAADDLLKAYMKNTHTSGISSEKFIEQYNAIKELLEKQGIPLSAFDELIGVLEQFPLSLKITFKEQIRVNPTNEGIYLVGAVTFDPNYIPEAAMGTVLISENADSEKVVSVEIEENQMFEYTGEPQAMKVTVKDKDGNEITGEALEKNLTVTYLGLNAESGIYNDTEAPIYPGVYSVVAVYNEVGEDGECVNFGMNAGGMIIGGKRVPIEAKDTEVSYDGTGKTVEVENADGCELITVFADENQNINVILPESWGIEEQEINLGVSFESALDQMKDIINQLPENDKIKEDDVNAVFAELEKLLSMFNLTQTIKINGNGPTEVGKYQVLVLAYGDDYAYGADTATLTITERDYIVESVKSSATKMLYTGKKCVPTITVTDTYGDKLVNGTDYTVAVYNAKGNKVATPTAVGKYTVKVTFTGNYADNAQKSLTYSIIPKAVTNLKASLVPANGYNSVKLTWTKATGATGYYVYYKKSTAASYTNTNRKAVTGNTATFKNLAGGTKYNFKVVPYFGTNKTTSTKYTTITKTTLKKVVGVKVTRTGKKTKVSWTNINGETGYQISRATTKTGTANIKTYAGVNLKTKTITLSTAKKYYYKVRAYKVENGKKVFGPWSAVVYK